MSDLQMPGASVTVTRVEDRRRLLWAGGTVFDVVLGGEQTAGTLALLDQTGRAGDATPLHVHRTDAEVFYVLDGAATAWVGDVVSELVPGTAAYLPAGLAHALRVEQDGTRILTITAPAGFADFVRQAGVSVDGPAPATWDFDLGRIMGAAAQHGIDIVGPPPQ
jgi:quercetin dioxygenase-like cupin family protein